MSRGIGILTNLELYQSKSRYQRADTAARPVGRGIYRDHFKRVLDVVLAILLLPFVLPLILALCLAVSLQGGNGLYSQPRIGRGGEVFRFWKIRTMAPNAKALLKAHLEVDSAAAAEWSETQKLRHDPRITRFGAFLRATSLDELPQIFNVLKGDMSFVGPRPFMPEQAELYGEDRAYYDLRPGITGLWQVESRNRGPFQDRIHYDEAYARSISLGGDLAILMRTTAQIFRAEGC
jgi:lipopolysaccharide/colanic/teichoic acid biosynthesis glycosyltransferase